MSLESELIRLSRKVDELERLIERQRTEVPRREWQTWVPILTQGTAVAHTVAYARYLVDGRLVICEWSLTPTAAGTAANSVRISGLPFQITTVGRSIGWMHVQDPGNTNYSGITYSIGSLEVAFISGNLGDLFGVAPAYTIAVGDNINGGIVYERA